MARSCEKAPENLIQGHFSFDFSIVLLGFLPFAFIFQSEVFNLTLMSPTPDI